MDYASVIDSSSKGVIACEGLLERVVQGDHPIIQDKSGHATSILHHTLRYILDQHYKRVTVVYVCYQPQCWHLHAMAWLHVKDRVRGSNRMVTQPLIKAMRQAFYTNAWDNILDQHYKHCMVVSVCYEPQLMPLHSIVWLLVKGWVRGSYWVVTQPFKINVMRQALDTNPCDKFLDQHSQRVMVVSVCYDPQWLLVHLMVWLQVKDCMSG